MRTNLRIAVCVGALVAALPMTVAAKPLVHEHYSGSFDETFADDTCGEEITIDHHVDFDGLFKLRTGKRGAELFMDNYHAVETYTNVANGATATIVAQGMTKDVHVVVDGDLVYVTQIETGKPITVFGPSGERLIFDAGRIRYTFTIDTQGTEDPADDVLTFDEPSIAGPHPVFLGEADFCDLLDVLR